MSVWKDEIIPFSKMSVKDKLTMLMELMGNEGKEQFTIYADSWAKNARLAEHLTAHGVTIRNKGEWREENSRRKSSMFVCSACGCVAYYPQPTRDKNWGKHCPYKYCPNCGAEMKGE